VLFRSMTSGWASLCGAIYLGRHTPEGAQAAKSEPANVAYVILGTALLWIGWFGFNAGSALGAGPLAGTAFLNTHIAAASSMMMWLAIDYLREKKMKATAACCGAVVGLVVITPAAGYVNVGCAMVMGILGCIGCYFTNVAMGKFFSYVDDSLEVFPCHGMGGTIGMFLTGVFASKEYTLPATTLSLDGLFYSGPELFWKHCVAIVGVIAYIVLITFLCLIVTDYLSPLRVSLEEEVMGLDASQHGEKHVSMKTPGV